MAGDWIKVEHATPDKPELVMMAEILDVDQDAILGKVIRLWIWADQQSQDGNALSVTDSFLDRITFLPGFANACRKVGWLEGREGRLSIPNFSRHNGQSSKQRAVSNRRVSEHRGKKRNCNESVTLEALPKALPEKRREEIVERESKTREREIPSVESCEEHARSHAPEQHAEFAASVAREFHGVFSAMEPPWITRGGDDLARSQKWKHKLNSKIESELRNEISRERSRGKPRDPKPKPEKQDWSTDGITTA